MRNLIASTVFMLSVSHASDMYGDHYFTRSSDMATEIGQRFQGHQEEAALPKDPRFQEYFNAWVNYSEGHYLEGDARQQKFAAAYEGFRVLAERGHSTSMARLGHMHLNGLIENPDLTFAKNQLESAAERGEPQAYCDLGIMYRDGIGVPQDKNRAEELFWQAKKIWMEKEFKRGHAGSPLRLTLADNHLKTLFTSPWQQWNERAQYETKAFGVFGAFSLLLSGGLKIAKYAR